MSRNQKFQKIVSSLKRMPKLLRRSGIIFILAIFITSIFILLYKPRASAQIFLTSGTTWTVPGDWNNSNNVIETIGGGAGGAGGFTDSSGSGGGGGGGGGAGGYARITNVTLTPGSTVTIAVGTAGTGSPGSATPSNGNPGGDTYLCNSTSGCTSITDTAVIVGAKGGSGGIPGTNSTGGTGGAGGVGTSGVGTVRFNGGTGGTPSAPASANGSGGGGGAGAGGHTNNGNNGAANTATIVGGVGGQGDGTAGGSAGTAGSASVGGTGGNGTEYDSSHGSGGGGGGGAGISNGSGFNGGNGGQYGAAGGGGGGNGNKHGTGGNGGNGIQGLIRITYSFTTLSDYRWRLDDGSETTGTSLASQDTAATINSTQIARLRVLITNTGDTTTDTFQLEYAPYTSQCGSWTAVATSAGAVTTQHFNMYNTSNYTDQTASTNVTSGPGVITDPSGSTFAAGDLISSPDNSSVITLASGQFTESEYAIQVTSNATAASYCFRVTNAGTPLDSYTNYPILNVNYPPSAPTIYSVQNGSTNVSRVPIFQLRSTDLNSDYLQYRVEICAANSFPSCLSSGGITYDETSAQTCWSGQNANSGAAYASSPTELLSTMAYCQLQVSDILISNTTYYWQAKAIDPAGSNTFGPYSSVASFTTGTLDIQINGGASITGGTKIGN